MSNSKLSYHTSNIKNAPIYDDNSQTVAVVKGNDKRSSTTIQLRRHQGSPSLKIHQRSNNCVKPQCLKEKAALVKSKYISQSVERLKTDQSTADTASNSGDPTTDQKPVSDQSLQNKLDKFSCPFLTSTLYANIYPSDIDENNKKGFVSPLELSSSSVATRHKVPPKMSSPSLLLEPTNNPTFTMEQNDSHDNQQECHRRTNNYLSENNTVQLNSSADVENECFKVCEHIVELVASSFDNAATDSTICIANVLVAEHSCWKVNDSFVAVESNFPDETESRHDSSIEHFHQTIVELVNECCMLVSSDNLLKRSFSPVGTEAAPNQSLNKNICTELKERADIAANIKTINDKVQCGTASLFKENRGQDMLKSSIPDGVRKIGCHQNCSIEKTNGTNKNNSDSFTPYRNDANPDSSLLSLSLEDVFMCENKKYGKEDDSRQKQPQTRSSAIDTGDDSIQSVNNANEINLCSSSHIENSLAVKMNNRRDCKTIVQNCDHTDEDGCFPSSQQDFSLSCNQIKMKNINEEIFIEEVSDEESCGNCANSTDTPFLINAQCNREQNDYKPEAANTYGVDRPSFGCGKRLDPLNCEDSLIKGFQFGLDVVSQNGNAEQFSNSFHEHQDIADPIIKRAIERLDRNLQSITSNRDNPKLISNGRLGSVDNCTTHMRRREPRKTPERSQLRRLSTPLANRLPNTVCTTTMINAQCESEPIQRQPDDRLNPEGGRMKANPGDLSPSTRESTSIVLNLNSSNLNVADFERLSRSPSYQPDRFKPTHPQQMAGSGAVYTATLIQAVSNRHNNINKNLLITDDCSNINSVDMNNFSKDDEQPLDLRIENKILNENGLRTKSMIPNSLINRYREVGSRREPGYNTRCAETTMVNQNNLWRPNEWRDHTPSMMKDQMTHCSRYCNRDFDLTNSSMQCSNSVPSKWLSQLRERNGCIEENLNDQHFNQMDIGYPDALHSLYNCKDRSQISRMESRGDGERLSCRSNMSSYASGIPDRFDYTDHLMPVHRHRRYVSGESVRGRRPLRTADYTEHYEHSSWNDQFGPNSANKNYLCQFPYREISHDERYASHLSETASRLPYSMNKSVGQCSDIVVNKDFRGNAASALSPKRATGYYVNDPITRRALERFDNCTSTSNNNNINLDSTLLHHTSHEPTHFYAPSNGDSALPVDLERQRNYLAPQLSPSNYNRESNPFECITMNADNSIIPSDFQDSFRYRSFINRPGQIEVDDEFDRSSYRPCREDYFTHISSSSANAQPKTSDLLSLDCVYHPSRLQSVKATSLSHHQPLPVSLTAADDPENGKWLNDRDMKDHEVMDNRNSLCIEQAKSDSAVVSDVTTCQCNQINPISVDFERQSEHTLKPIFDHLERRNFKAHSSNSAFLRTPTYQYKSFCKEYTKPATFLKNCDTFSDLGDNPLHRYPVTTTELNSTINTDSSTKCALPTCVHALNRCDNPGYSYSNLEETSNHNDPMNGDVLDKSQGTHHDIRHSSSISDLRFSHKLSQSIKHGGFNDTVPSHDAVADSKRNNSIHYKDDVFGSQTVTLSGRSTPSLHSRSAVEDSLLLLTTDSRLSSSTTTPTNCLTEAIDKPTTASTGPAFVRSSSSSSGLDRRRKSSTDKESYRTYSSSSTSKDFAVKTTPKVTTLIGDNKASSPYRRAISRQHLSISPASRNCFNSIRYNKSALNSSSVRGLSSHSPVMSPQSRHGSGKSSTKLDSRSSSRISSACGSGRPPTSISASTLKYENKPCVTALLRSEGVSKHTVSSSVQNMASSNMPPSKTANIGSTTIQNTKNVYDRLYSLTQRR